MYQVIAYIKFLFKSTNQHGVHSPFIYDFVTKCLYDKTLYKDYIDLENYRNSLLRSETILEVNDLGQGSKILDKHRRKVAHMAKTSSSSSKNSKLLYRLNHYFKFKRSLELGTSLGMATYAIYLGYTNGQITTIEGCPNTSDLTKSKFAKLGLKDVNFIKGDFANTIAFLKNDYFDLIFFDGHHNKDATIEYFEALLPKVNNTSVFIFDDIYWSKGMTDAWDYIKNHKAVTVTVDCFYLGFVFFRREQAKEHFKIRL